MKKIALLVAVVSGFFSGLAHSANISVVGARSELDTIRSGFSAFGDTVTWYNQVWSGLTATQLDTIFASDIVWEGDVFSQLSSDVQTRMTNFVNGNHGLFLTGERSCCESHNDGVEAVGRVLTGDSGLLVGGLGFDVFNHQFSNSPTTILTAPNDIRGQTAQHNGPGRVSPTGDVSSDACFVTSEGGTVCTAGAWGPDVLTNKVGRLVIYGDINSQPSLVDNFNGDQFENIRQFLLTGFSGGGDVCQQNPNLPGCNPNNNVPEPATVALLGLALAGLGFQRRRKVS